MTSQYAVERIVAKKVVDGKSFYRIKWIGWSTRDNTWEPYQHIPQDVIREFEQEEAIRIKQKQKKQNTRKLKTLYYPQNVAIEKEIKWHYKNITDGLMFRVKIGQKQAQLTRDEVLQKHSDLLCRYYIALAKQKGNKFQMFKEYSSFCSSCRKNNKNSITLDCKHSICIHCIAALLINHQASEMLLDEIQVECKDYNYVTLLSIPLAYKLTRCLNLKNVPGQSQIMKINLFCMQCLQCPFTLEQYLSGQHKNHKIKTLQQAVPFLINILSYAAKDLQQSVKNLYSQQEKLQHCIHLMNDVVTANVAKIKLGFQQLRSQINKREEEIELAYRIAVQKQFRTVQIDLEQLHKIIAQGKSQLEWILDNTIQNQNKLWRYQQKIYLANYFTDNFPTFSILRQFQQSIKEKVPSYKQMIRLNAYIVSINGMKPIVDSIRHLKCFEEQDIDQNSTETSSTLSSSYFEEKKKQIFGDKDINYPYDSKLTMMNERQKTGKKIKNKMLSKLLL